MQATQSNNASDLLRSGTTDLGSAHAGPARTRELPSLGSTPIFLGPIQAARKYMERQRSGGSTAEVARDGVRGGAGGLSDASGFISGLPGREQSVREQASREQASREQDRRLERSLYEGHSIEAGLNYETESAAEGPGSSANGRAFVSNGDGTERLFPYAEPNPDSIVATATAPNPEAVRGAILRLARESRPMLDSPAGAAAVPPGYSTQANAATGKGIAQAGQDTLAVRQMKTKAEPTGRPAAGLPFAATRLSLSPDTDTPVLPASPAFADVARRVWAREAVENGTPAAFVADDVAAVAMKDGLAAQKQGKDTEDVQHFAGAGGGSWATEAAKTAFVKADEHLVTNDAPCADREGRRAHQGSLAGPPSIADPQAANATAVLPLPLAVDEQSTMRSDAAGHAEKFQGAALAHDACNLLSALGLYSDLLNSPGVLDEPHRHYAEELKLIAVRSQLLIDRLLRLRDRSDASSHLATSGGVALGTTDSSVAGTLPELDASDSDTWGDTWRDTRDPGTRDLDTRDPETRDPETRRRETAHITLAYTETSAASPPEGLGLLPLPPARQTALAENQPDAGPQSATRSTPVAVPSLIADAQTVSGKVSLGVAVLSADRTTSFEENERAQGESTIATSQIERSLGSSRQAIRPEVSEAVGSEMHQEGTLNNEVWDAENEPRPGRNELPAEDAPRATAAGLPASEVCPTSLVDLLMRWGSLLSTLAHGTLDISFGPQAATPVAIAAESLERILVNLVKNARAATINGGAIRIGVGVCDAQPAQVTRSESGAHAGSSVGGLTQQSVVLTVDDSGCGMSEAEVMQILAVEQIEEAHIPSSVEPQRVTASGIGASQLGPSHRVSGGQALEVTHRDPLAGSYGQTGADPGLPLEADRVSPGSLHPASPASARGAASRGSKQGRGLGLRVVKGLVAETGGALTIHSRVGRGTRIEIRWPGAGSIPVAARPATERSATERSATERPATERSATERSATARPDATPVEQAEIPILPETSLASSFGPMTPGAGSPAEPPAIGPDGFSEDELRSMMLRLHRTGLSGHGQVQHRGQSSLDRRRGAQETPTSGGLASTRAGIEPGRRATADFVTTDRFGPESVTADRLGTGVSPATIYPPITHPESSHPEIAHAECTHLESTRLESTHLQSTHLQGTHLQSTHLQSKGAIAC